jgi:prolyl-tRNA synthetase
MKGVPIRIEIGPRDLKNNVATIARRDTGSKETVYMDDILEVIKKHANLLDKAKSRLEERIFDCNTLDNVKNKVQNGITRISWCGEYECGFTIENAVGASILGILEGELGRCNGSCPICGKNTERMVIIAKTY